MHLSFLWYKLLGKAKFTNESHVAYQAGAYPGFWAIKQPKVLLLPLDGMIVHRKVIPALSWPVAIYAPGWREALREQSVLSKNTTLSPWPRLEPAPLDP